MFRPISIKINYTKELLCLNQDLQFNINKLSLLIYKKRF
jgi:hypothetical protein